MRRNGIAVVFSGVFFLEGCTAATVVWNCGLLRNALLKHRSRRRVLLFFGTHQASGSVSAVAVKGL